LVCEYPSTTSRWYPLAAPESTTDMVEDDSPTSVKRDTPANGVTNLQVGTDIFQ
jgi:hypothetical protein